MDARQAKPSWPPAVRKTPEKAPVLSAEEEMKTLVLPPGYRVELVAKEPLVIDPIAIDFDADGRMWVLEMPGFMSEPGGANSREPINNVVVLEDENGDGTMDKRTVFAEKLVLPRALKVLDAGVLVGEPPNLWLMKDTNGDLKMDVKELVSETYGRAAASIEHNANSLHWGLDNIIYTSEHDWHLLLRNGKFETMPTLRSRPVGRVDGRRRPHLPERERRAAVRRLGRGEVFRPQPESGPDPRPLRPADLAGSVDDLADPGDARRQSRLSRSVLPARRQLRDHSGRRHAGDLPRRSPAEGTVRRRVHHRLDRPISCIATRSRTTGPDG